VMRDAPPGMIRAAHHDVLRSFCEATSTYVAAQKALAATSLLVKRRDGLVKNPLLQVVRDLRDQQRLLARELGLTPAAAAGMAVGLPYGGPAAGPDIDDDLGPPGRFRLVAGGRA
jgi:P27 family predicted phage terminase small subunit